MTKPPLYYVKTEDSLGMRVSAQFPSYEKAFAYASGFLDGFCVALPSAPVKVFVCYEYVVTEVK